MTSDFDEGWTRIKDEHPPPHQRYLLRRNDNIYTATPCYGIHAPWWVVKALLGGELEPVPMLDDDEWRVYV